ncbi:MAG: hypothetical protein V7K81_23920, partial [Nostoc sp.]
APSLGALGIGQTGNFFPMPHAPCPMPHAPCPIPHAPFPMPHSPCPKTPTQEWVEFFIKVCIFKISTLKISVSQISILTH